LQARANQQVDETGRLLFLNFRKPETRTPKPLLPNI